jgi:hypothetical protein
MTIDRRRLLLTGGALLASCRAGSLQHVAGAQRPGPSVDPLDALLAAHAGTRPENAGGANHYPMAAEVMEAFAHADAIPAAWRTGARGYRGPVDTAAPIEAGAEPFGRPESFDAWAAHFARLLARDGCRATLGVWVPRLAAGFAGAACHGVIRTGHAARALQRRDTPARRCELAQALAYWAAHYVELPASAEARAGGGEPLALVHAAAARAPADPTAVPFAAVTGRLVAAGAATARVAAVDGEPLQAMEALVHAAATGLLEMLVQERHRIWLLHAVTAPAAAALLLPSVDAAGAERLLVHARHATVAWFAAFGAPFVARAHLARAPAPWPESIAAAVASGSVHTLKLVEALYRCDSGDDPLARSVAARWLAWR